MTPTQSWDPERYARSARFVSDLALPVVELLAPQPDERILDLGCGDGVLTEKLVAAGCKVLGVDASPAMVAATQKRGLSAQVIVAEQLPFGEEFDAVFSNAALHWMKQPDAVIAGVWRALKPGGRFVAEFGGQGNIAKVMDALASALRRRGLDPDTLNPWYFPSAAEYRQRLLAGGFTVTYLELIPRPTRLPGDVTDWLELFTGSFTAPLPAAEGPSFLAEVRETMRPHLCDAGGQWIIDQVRLRFAARK
jgi:SAM-dependent methyltransferase